MWPALLLVLGTLPACLGTESVDDAVLLIQGSWLVPPVFAGQRPNQPSPFSLKRGARHFAGSARLSVDIAGIRVHFWDIALYVNASNRVWFNVTHQRQALDGLLGEALFVLVPRSHLVNRKAVADFTVALAKALRELNTKNCEGAVEEYQQIFLRGPKVTPGIEILVEPRKDVVVLHMDGKRLGSVSSSCLGRAVLEAHLGQHAEQPEFRSHVWAQLAEGHPEEITPPAQVEATMGLPTWAVFVIFAVCFVAACSVVGGVFCCLRLRGSSVG